MSSNENWYAIGGAVGCWLLSLTALFSNKEFSILLAAMGMICWSIAGVGKRSE